jgi:glucose-1-phosphatase
VSIALVLFDLDEVLSHYSHPARLAVLAERSGRTAEAVHAALFDSGLESESDLGLWSPQAYADEFGRRLGARLTLDDLIAARAASMRANADTLRLAHAVARTAEVAILTNNGLYMRDRMRELCPPLLPLFAGRVRFAAEFGAVKPDPEVYLRCLHALGAAPERTLFIDDKSENVRGAHRAGLHAVQFGDAARLHRDLHSHRLIEASVDA